MPEHTHRDILYDTCMEIEGAVIITPQAQPQTTAELSFGRLPEELGFKGWMDDVLLKHQRGGFFAEAGAGLQ